MKTKRPRKKIKSFNPGQDIPLIIKESLFEIVFYFGMRQLMNEKLKQQLKKKENTKNEN